MDNLQDLIHLKLCVDTKNVKRAGEILEIAEKSVQQLTTAQIAFAMQIMFGENKGTLAFLQRIQQSMSENFKIFESCIMQVFKFHVSCITEFTEHVRSYVHNIIELCVKYMQSSYVSAKIKYWAVTTMYNLTDVKIIDPNDVESLVQELFNNFDSRRTSILYGKEILLTLGLISKRYPAEMMKFHTNLRLILIETIEIRLLERNFINFRLLAGAVQALCDHLNNFPPEVNEVEEFSNKIYNYIKMLSGWDKDGEKEAYRNAIRFFTVHYRLFHLNIFNDAKYWHNMLNQWVQSSIYEEKKIGLYATYSFHHSMAITLEERQNPEDKDKLQYLIRNFKFTLENANSTFHNIRIAVRGFGTLSKACRILLDQNFVSELLTLVLQRIKYSDYKDDSEKSRKLLEHLPDYIQSLSEIMINVENLTAMHLSYLDTIVVQLLRDFYYLNSVHHELVLVSLLETFTNLYKLEGAVANEFINKVIFQGVAWTCDRILPYDLDWEDADWKDNVTYRNYLPLWQGLVCDKLHPEFDRPETAKKILHVMLNTLLGIIEKLNFNTTKRMYQADDDQEFYFCDPNIDLMPVKPQDFHIFFNLVELYVEVLEKLSLEFKKEASFWMERLCEELVQKVFQYPLVSGFIKLLEVIIKIGKQINYFEPVNIENANAEHTKIQQLLKAFLNISLQKITQYTSELQVSYLRLIFTFPVLFIKNFIHEMAEVFVIAFNYGKNVTDLWISSMALRCLEELVEEVQGNELKIMLQIVLPYLETYLSSQTEAVKMETKIESVESKKGRKSKIRRKYNLDGEDTDLMKFQKRILLLLGKFSPEECQFMLNHDKQSVDLVKWELRDHIEFKIKNHSMYLDPLLPRVVHLALNSSDRKTKVAACELLHTSVIFLIGTKKLSTVTWKELCSKIIQLGCDTDATVHDMFEPLLYQIAHYFSQPDFIHSSGTQIFVEALLELISYPNNNSVQDLSAKLLRELVAWSLRHNRQEQQATAPTNLKKLFDSLKFYSTNSELNKRKAACLAFNNIYHILKDEEQLISNLWMDLFYNFCINYIMCENHYIEQHIPVQLEPNNIVLENMLKIFIKKKHILQVDNRFRNIPDQFHDGNLQHVATWVLQQCGSIQQNYRIKCMDIFVHLAKTLSIDNTIESFISNELIPQEHFIQIFEKHPNGIGFNVTIQSLLQRNNPRHALRIWLENLLLAVDGYNWIITRNLVPSIKCLFESPDLKLFEALSYFIRSVLFATLNEICSVYAVSEFEESTDLHYFDLDMNKTLETIKILKRKVLLRTVELIRNAFMKDPESLPKQFLINNEEKFKELANYMIFEPHNLDLPVYDAHEVNTVRKCGVNFMQSIQENCSDYDLKNRFISYFAQCQRTVIEYLAETLTDDLSTTEVSTNKLLKAKGLYYSVQKLGVSDALINHRFVHHQQVIFKQVFNSIAADTFLNNSHQQIAINHSLQIKECTSILLKISLLNKHLIRVLVLSIFNETELKTSPLDSTIIKHGEHFLSTYKNVLMEYSCRNINDIVKIIYERLNAQTFIQVVKFICGLAQFLKKNYTNEPQLKRTLIDSVMQHMKKFIDLEINIPESALYIIDLISNLMMIYEGQFNQMGENELLCNWFINLISKNETALDVKTKALFILPCITDPECSCQTDSNLSKCLEDHLQHKHFPLSSDEFKPGSIKRDSYVACFQAVLEALVASKSPMMFMFLIKATAPDSNHILETEIRQAIDKFCAYQSDAVLTNILSCTFQLLCEQKYTPEIRTTILKRFLLTVLKSSPEAVIKIFFIDHGRNIKSLMERNVWTVNGFIDKLVAFKIVEMIFGLLPKEFLSSANSPFYDAASTNQKASAIIPLIKLCTSALGASASHIMDPNLLEYFRKYQCAVYNCLIAIISNTQAQVLLYESLLFKRDQLLWQKLINPKPGVYQMESQELEDYPIIKKRIVTIRNINKIIGLKENRHFHTTSIYNSSLSQDVLKLDLSNTIVRSNADIVSRQLAAAQLGKITLEKMVLNDHEVMPNMCALINHMHDNKIMSYNKVPVWIDNFCYILEEHPVQNVRQFIAKVIDNCRDVFKNVAARVYRAILKFLSDGAAGTILNTFIIDLCVLLLEWSEVHKINNRDEQILADKLIMFLIKNSFHERPDILKSNLELLKSFVELWKHFLTLPTEYLYETLLRGEDAVANNKIYGIHLSAIMLSSDLVPWTPNNKQLFFNAVYNLMYDASSNVYRPAAQLLGMCFKKDLEQNPDSNFLENELIQTIIARLRKDFIRQENNCLEILYGIQKYCFQILEPLMHIVTDKIPNAVSKMKEKYLEMFLTGMQFCDLMIFKEMINSLNIRQLLKMPEYQLMGLHIVNKALPLIKPLEGLYLYTDVLALIKHASPELRDVVYEILIYMYKHYRNLVEIDKIHIRRMGNLLLEGILDEDSEIQVRLMQFWNNEEQLPNVIPDRMSSLLSDIYDSEKDKNFLITCAQLLLQPAIVDPFSATSWFSAPPIGDVKYWERKIDTSWRRNSQYVKPPLFVETRTLKATLASLCSQQGIRATHDYDETFYSPTIDPVTMYTAKDTFRSQIVTQNSLFIDTQSTQMNRRSAIQVVQGREDNKDYSRFRKRFLKSRETAQRENILSAINRRKVNEKKLYYIKKERQLSVQLYRRYRDGDFPDFRLNILAILLPLQALVKHDTFIAQQLFVALFELSIKFFNSKDDQELYLMQMGRHLYNIMTTSQSLDSGLYSALLNIGLKYAHKIKIPPQIISNSARATNNLSLGILFLEEHLIHMDTEEPPNKKDSIASTSSMASEHYWIQLAELYRCLSEHDVLNGIFTEKIETDSRLPEAFNAMSDNRYEKAAHVWLEILNDFQNMEKVEQDFCFESYYDCLTALGDWDLLLKNVESQLTKIDEVWDQDFNQDVLLPHLLRCETRLVLEDRHQNKTFLENLERWSNVTQYWDHLLQNFIEELAMLIVVQGDFNKSRFIAERYLKSFLSEWSNLDVLCEKIRKRKLQDVRIISEIYSTVGEFFLARHTKNKVLEKAQKLYERAVPFISDSTLIWDNLITYRTYLTNSLLETITDDDLVGSKKTLLNAMHKQTIALFNVGLQQGNIGFASNILKRIKKDENIYYYGMLENKLKIKQAEMLPANTNDKLCKLAESFASLNDILGSNLEPTVRSECLQIMSQIGSMLLDIPADAQHIGHEIYHQYSRISHPSPADLYTKSYEYLKQSILLLEIESREKACEAYVKMAELSIKQLESNIECDKNELQKNIITYILDALSEGNSNARELFPRLLQLVDLQHPEIENMLVTKMAKVPEWLFIPWIPQILCYTNLHAECCLDNLIERLVNVYPNAMIYPLRLTLRSNKVTRVRPFLSKILNEIETPLMVNFINALSLICLPPIKVKTMVINLLKILSQPEITSTAFHAAVLEEKDILFAAKEMQGSAYHYHEKYNKIFDDLLKLDVKTSMNQIQSDLHKIHLDENRRLKLQWISTGQLCPWLANYQWCNTMESIEIPGQYNTMQRPFLDRHAKLIKVHSEVSVFQSLRRPIRIKFYGTDGKEYNFVIKYGEDLRQDERVQQLLSISSRKLNLNKNCKEQNLSIVTYSVTPVSENYGLLSWVPNTQPLKTILQDSLDRREDKDLERDLIPQTKNEFIELLCEAAELPTENYKTDSKRVHALAAINITREKAKLNFQKCLSIVPSNIFKWSFLDSASSMQNYYVLRNNYARSLAVINVTQWILGIGDRHWDNILVDTKTFTLVGIDFGHAFGTATRDLPIPELLPFRLTPQLVNVLQPLGVSGTLSRCMSHVLRCLRTERKIIKACMDVFVREPTLDWLVSAQSWRDGNRSWDPESRVNTANRKLIGANPLKLIEEELLMNKISSIGYHTGYVKLLRTNKFYGNETELSVDEQVKRLICHAQDEALLAVTWSSWLPFI